MGDRKCQFADCRSLTFRSTDYCWKHQEGKPHEKNPEITSTPEKTSQKPITEIWWVPIIPLLTFPLFAFDTWYIEQTDGYGTDLSFLYDLVYYLSFPFVILALFSPFLLPIYAVYLVRIRRQRIENGEWNLFIAMFHILSFTAPLLVLLVLWVLASALGGA